MNFKQFFGGVLVGLVIGMPIGAALVDEIDEYVIKRACLGVVLAYVGVVLARQDLSKR